MKSRTKRRLSTADIQAVLFEAFGPSAEVRSATEFTNGWFAAVFGVTLTDGRELVLKASPPADLRLLRYEVDLANTEIEFYRAASAAGVPVPTVRYADADRGYLITERLRGRTLDTVAKELTPEQEFDVRRQIGEICARINAVTGPAFGYPRRDGHTRSERWRTSFLTYIDDLVADAVEYDRNLPIPATEIGKLIHANADVLDEVDRPALVHFDLWDGNVFIVPDGDGYTVEAIIDGERAFYGDPIAELVSLKPFGDVEAVPGLLEGYFGQRRPLTDGERLRLRMYNIYLASLILTEDAVRGYDPVEFEPLRSFVFGYLEQELARLS